LYPNILYDHTVSGSAVFELFTWVRTFSMYAEQVRHATTLFRSAAGKGRARSPSIVRCRAFTNIRARNDRSLSVVGGADVVEAVTSGHCDRGEGVSEIM
jgi:hypothetical protein